MNASALVQFAVACVVLGAIWLLVDRFVTNPTLKLVIQVVGGAFILILAIRILASFAGI